MDINERDSQVWRDELQDFVPARVFDAHMHILDASCLRVPFPPGSPFRKFGGVFPLPAFLGWAAAWLPDRTLSINHFGWPSFDSDLEASARYTGSVSDNQRFFGMALVAPRDPVDTVRRRLLENRLVGLKPYLSFVEGKAVEAITIHDMLPDEQMALADALGLAIMLHIPRPGRLADPVNQQQMIDLCRRYPRTRIIIAHIGRAYCLHNVVGFLDGIAACPNAYIDTAMVNHEGVLEYAFRHFPRERILFGSDAPIACLRGKSVEINNQYAYLMGEDYAIGTSILDTGRAVAFTSFYYEQLRGIKLAAERARLGQREIEDIFFNNADRLFRTVSMATDNTARSHHA